MERYGYLPNPKQHSRGGYETWLGTNTLEDDSSEILTAELLEMLGELRGGSEDEPAIFCFGATESR